MLDEINKTLKDLESDKYYETDTYDKAIQLIYDYEIEHGGIGIVDCDTAEQILIDEVNRGGMIRAKFFLSDVSLGDDYYRIDAYGNLHNIDRDWLLTQLDDIKCEEEQREGE